MKKINVAELKKILFIRSIYSYM